MKGSMDKKIVEAELVSFNLNEIQLSELEERLEMMTLSILEPITDCGLHGCSTFTCGTFHSYTPYRASV